ncbi:MAG: 30S ribosomal protein S6 [Proteobacteria bacterium]|nr:30S ribosomal protein S6 [Pseudomonadota bacterium]
MATQMRTYETICLTKVDMPEDKYKALVDKCKDAVTSDKGQVLMLDLWGKAKIAYPINKEPRAQWTYFRYQASSGAVDAIRHQLKINEFVLRQITVRTSEDGADYNTLRANIGREIGEKFRENRDDRGFRGRGRRFEGGRGGERGDRGDRGGYRGDRDAANAAPNQEAAAASDTSGEKDGE